MSEDKQMVIPGSTSNSDVERIWEQFTAECKWMGDKESEKEAEVLTARLQKLQTTRDALNARIQEINDQLSNLQSRKTEARSYLDEAARSLGKFASPAVLLQILREKFPRPARKAKDSEEKNEAAGAEEAPAPAAAAPAAPRSADDEKRRVMSVLDREGMLMADLIEVTGQDSATLRRTLAELEKEGKIKTDGARRGKRYMLVAQEVES